LFSDETCHAAQIISSILGLAITQCEQWWKVTQTFVQYQNIRQEYRPASLYTQMGALCLAEYRTTCLAAYMQTYNLTIGHDYQAPRKTKASWLSVVHLFRGEGRRFNLENRNAGSAFDVGLQKKVLAKERKQR